MRGALIGAALAFAFANSSVSAQFDSLTVNLASLSSDGGSSARVVVTVLDGNSRPVVDLVADDFAVQLNGEVALVSGLERGVDSSLPISVLLALDVSGSMEGGALDEAKAAAISFLNSLELQDSVGVLTFADEVTLVLPFTQDRAAAMAAIEGLVAGGGTALYQATENGLRLAADEGTSYRAVILLSDGLDNGSVLVRDDVYTTAATLGVPVFAIGLGEDIDREYLESVATLSGGSFAETPSPAGLAQLYLKAGELLRGQYILTLDTTDLAFVAAEPALLRVEVASSAGAGSVARSVCAQALCVALGPILAGEEINAPQIVSATVISSEPVASVSFMVDGVLAVEVTEEPYQFAFDPAAFESGDRVLSVTVETVSGASQSSQLSVRIESAGGGLDMTLVIGAAAAAVGAIGLAFYLYFRTRRRPQGNLRKLDPANLTPPSKEAARVGKTLNPKLWPGGPPPAPPRPVEVKGRLYVSGGDMNGESFPVGAAPVSIGSRDTCAIRLSHESGDEEQIAGELLRVWVRDEQLMVHEIRRMTEAGSEGGRWVKLDPGDVFPVGPYTLRFELGAEADASKAIPNILRDPAAVNEEKDRAAAAVEANAAKAVPNILRDPAAVKEENDRTAPVEPQLEESKPASLPDFTPPLQPQPED
ncbi:MAG: VWA domain-containing protein [Chloroflexi bacterium]|nr:VWA domain-containing protein [Chloroflexota bacterium]